MLKAARARRRAATSLPDTARYVFGIEPPPHALVWLDTLEAVERGEIRQLCVIAPPGHAKSTYHSIVFPTWYLGRHPNDSIIGVTTTDRLGMLYGDTVKDVFEGDRFRRVFPDVVPDRDRGWSRDGLFLQGKQARPAAQKDASLVFIGAGGAVIGRRASGTIIDDAVDEAVARSEVMLEARKTWIRRSVFSRLKPKAWRIICGTLWTEDDVVDSAMRTGDYVVVHMEARSPNEQVVARIWIPNGVAWRPSRGVE